MTPPAQNAAPTPRLARAGSHPRLARAGSHPDPDRAGSHPDPDRVGSDRVALCAGAGRDRGAASLWALAVGIVLVFFAGSLALVGSAISARHQARTAADLAALAGAARALEGASVACGRANAYAEANGAALQECRLDGFDLIVTATVATPFGDATASARAGPIS